MPPRIQRDRQLESRFGPICARDALGSNRLGSWFAPSVALRWPVAGSGLEYPCTGSGLGRKGGCVDQETSDLSNRVKCSRCRRAPNDDADYVGWEALDEGAVCPG